MHRHRRRGEQHRPLPIGEADRRNHQWWTTRRTPLPVVSRLGGRRRLQPGLDDIAPVWVRSKRARRHRERPAGASPPTGGASRFRFRAGNQFRGTNPSSHVPSCRRSRGFALEVRGRGPRGGPLELVEKREAMKSQGAQPLVQELRRTPFAEWCRRWICLRHHAFSPFKTYPTPRSVLINRCGRAPSSFFRKCEM